MPVYTNRLPIHFGEGGILLYELGFERSAVPTSMGGKSPFEHCGVWYAIAPHNPLPEYKLRPSDPVDLPGVVLPYLMDRVCALLSRSGKVGQTASGVEYVDGKGAVFILRIDLDLSRRTYFLRITSSLGQASETNAYGQFLTLVNRVSDSWLPDSGAKIGLLMPMDHTSLSLPSLIFDTNGTQHSTSAKDGLLKYGPYDRKEFGGARLKVLVIGRAQSQLRLSSLIHDLKAGIPTPNEVARVWGKPWHETFRFSGVEFKFLLVETYRQAASRTQIEALVAAEKATEQPFDIVIYEADQTASKLESLLMRMGLPSHLLVPSELGSEGVERATLLLDLALTLYAKVGGKAWLLPLKKLMGHQLVVGIGSETLGTGVLGYATIFSSHGNYRLGEAKWNASEAEWHVGIADFVTRQLTRLGRLDGWANGDTLQISFHLDQKWPIAQTAQLKAAIADRLGPEYDLTISFLALSYVHDYRLWDAGDAVGGVAEPPNNLLPNQGTVVKISDCQYLIQMCDPSLPRAERNPLLIELLSGSDKGDFGFLVAQIFSFASLSWRSVDRATLPATLEYGKLVAGKGKLFQTIDPDTQIPDKFLFIPWYL
jgi:hypothetical protein